MGIESINVENISKTILKFEELLKRTNISEEIQEEMLINLRDGLESFEIRDMKDGSDGQYIIVDKKIIMSAKMLKDSVNWNSILIHEMLHAASTHVDEFGFVESLGVEKTYAKLQENEYVLVSNASNSMKNRFDQEGTKIYLGPGIALNEGLTEYFSSKIIKENKMPFNRNYSELVSISEDLIDLYGEDVVVKAYMGKQDLLCKLMEKDGKYFSEFLEVFDDYYRSVYNNNKGLSVCKAKKENVAKIKYKETGQFIEDIKVKRKKDNQNVKVSESNWKKERISKEKETPLLTNILFGGPLSKELKSLYGNCGIISSLYVNVEMLEQLMANDGKDYDELIKISKEFELAKNQFHKGIEYQQLSRLKYRNLVQFFQDIKNTRKIYEPEVKYPQSGWQEYYVEYLNGKIEDTMFLQQESSEGEILQIDQDYVKNKKENQDKTKKIDKELER